MVTWTLHSYVHPVGLAPTTQYCALGGTYYTHPSSRPTHGTRRPYSSRPAPSRHGLARSTASAHTVFGIFGRVLRNPSATQRMEEPTDVATLVSSLNADSESARKYAVFKLKGLLRDPSFADAFIQYEGLPALRRAVLDTTGNTQAYALGSLDALLELDMGWECCDREIVEKVYIHTDMTSPLWRWRCQ